MSLILGGDHHTEVLDVHFDPTNPGREPEDTEAEGLEVVKFYLRPFTGGDQKQFSDMIMVGKGKRQRYALGSMNREKVVRATTRIEGPVEHNGRPVTKMTGDVYDMLPSWMLNRVLGRINEMNEIDEDEEGN